MMDFQLSRSGARPLRPGPALRGRTEWPKRRLAGLFAGGLALIATSVVWSASAQPAPHPREKTYIKRTWGVEVMYVRETAAGYMLELRYKVLDAEKAKSLFERQTKPVLTHVATGARLAVPTPAKTGALRNSNLPIAGRTYWMVFANPGNLVKPGDQVIVEIGEFSVDLVVR